MLLFIYCIPDGVGLVININVYLYISVTICIYWEGISTKFHFSTGDFSLVRLNYYLSWRSGQALIVVSFI